MAALIACFGVLHLSDWSCGTPLAPHDPLYLQATTACLAAIIAAQVVNVFLCRHPREAALSFPWFGHRLLLIGLVVEVGLLLFIVFTPPGNWLFGTQAFPVEIWGLIALLALLVGILEETRKAVFRRWILLR